MAMVISSPMFESGGDIPVKYTCDGENISPPLTWRGIPQGTECLVLICDDPDAGTIEPFTHWILYCIPPYVRELPESFISQRNSFSWEGTLGRNSYSNVRYDGPCPPSGETHRYYFRLYALDESLDLAPGVNRDQLLKLIKEYVLETCEVIGHYTRR